MAQQERQAGGLERTVESSVARLAARGQAGQQEALVAGVAHVDALHRHHRLQHEGHGVDVQWRLLIVVVVAESIAVLVLDLLALLLLLLLPLALALAGVDVLQDGHLVVQLLELGRGIQGDVAAVLDCVAEAVLGKRGAVPSVGALVPDVRGSEVDERELVQRQPVGRRDLVVVARDLPEVLDVGPHRVAVLGIRFGVIPVDHARRLPDEGGGPAGVVQLEALGHIVLDDVIPVPVPLLEHLRTDKHPRLDAEQLGGVVPHSAGLVRPVHAHVDGDLLQPGIEVEVGEPAEGLGAPEEGEWLDFLRPVGKVVTDAPAVLPADVELGVDVALVVLRVSEVGAEVARVEKAQEAAAVAAPSGSRSARRPTLGSELPVPGHIVRPLQATRGLLLLLLLGLAARLVLFALPLAADLRVNLDVGEVDAADAVDLLGLFLALAAEPGISDLHIRRQRIELRGRHRLAVTEIERKLNPKEVRQEFAELQGRVGVHTLDRFPLALLHPLLESTPSRG